jgi:hypothetical protein
LNFKSRVGQKPFDKPETLIVKPENSLIFYFFSQNSKKMNFVPKIDRFFWFSVKPVRSSFWFDIDKWIPDERDMLHGVAIAKARDIDICWIGWSWGVFRQPRGFVYVCWDLLAEGYES